MPDFYLRWVTLELKEKGLFFSEGRLQSSFNRPFYKTSIFIITQKQTSVDIGKIFSLHGKSFSERYPQSKQGYKAINLIKACRTSTLGGHLHECGDCGYSKPMYNSCRCRFCPKCQTLTKERWLEKRKSEFIDTDYYHGVFTIPSELNALARQNPEILYKILFRAVSETLQNFAKTEYNGQLGFISVLHTWNQKLDYHVHLHCVIAGGVMLYEEKKWKRLKSSKFLFSVKALSQVFKSKFIAALRKKSGELKFRGDLAFLQDAKAFNDFLDQLYSKDWVVYAKKSFGGAMQVVEYLGRYTHRVAISNYRILKLENDEVHFKYRDRKDNNQEKVLTLEVHEFLRRFMLHILPAKFSKIRYQGFLSNKYKKNNLSAIFEQLKMPTRVITELSLEDFVKKITGREINQCPHCEKLSLQKLSLEKDRAPP